jgi:primosomal protein N' (replication factor Y)
VEILDLKEQEKDPGLPFWLTPTLFQAMQETLEKGEQVALFLNRRGMAQMVLCPGCGYTHDCPNCDINLTLHGRQHLVCHYCDYHESFRLECPSCKVGEMSPIGLGTELVQTEIQKLFPEATVARADRDEIQNRLELEELVQDMESGKTNILVGTQMIAKGLDFPNLNLVGLLLADVGFNLPDFRATERSFQLITQVSGRAGRHVRLGEGRGRVIVQTYNPSHPSLVFAQNHDFVSFGNAELLEREPLFYPPFGRLVSFRIQGTQLERVQEGARLLSRRSQQLKSQNGHYEKVEILGPAEAPLAKLRGQFRYHLLLKGIDAKTLNHFCRQVLGDQKWLPTAVRVSADVDPLHLL